MHVNLELVKTNLYFLRRQQLMEHVFAQGLIVIGTAAAVAGISGSVKRICKELLSRPWFR